MYTYMYVLSVPLPSDAAAGPPDRPAPAGPPASPLALQRAPKSARMELAAKLGIVWLHTATASTGNKLSARGSIQATNIQ